MNAVFILECELEIKDVCQAPRDAVILQARMNEILSEEDQANKDV